jgi:hypothetical protein
MLIQNYKKKTYVEGLKTGISILTQGFRKSMADEGVDDFSNTEMNEVCNYMNLHTSDNINACKAILLKYFKAAKFQSVYDLSALGDKTAFLDTATCQKMIGRTNRWWYLNDKTQCWGSRSGISVILSSGMKANLVIYPIGKIAVGEIYLDINGEKGPNTFGRDAFYLLILHNGNVVGYYDGQYAKAASDANGSPINVTNLMKQAEINCSSTSTNYGSFCAGRIINDGWKMNY